MTKTEYSGSTSPALGSEARRPSGPPLAPIAIASMALFMMSLAIPMLLSGAVYPSPFGDGEQASAYFRDHTLATTITALLQFAAALPVAIYAAVAMTRLTHLGVRAPGSAIAFAGGLLTASAMTTSAFATWSLTRPSTLENEGLLHLMHDMAFIAGGPGAVVPLGLLVAGIAVPGLLARLLPRWLAVVGLILAGIAVLGTLVVAVPGLALVLPLARFPSLVWLIVAGLLLPKHRVSRNREA